jgi:hypothetical protein
MSERYHAHFDAYSKYFLFFALFLSSCAAKISASEQPVVDNTIVAPLILTNPLTKNIPSSTVEPVVIPPTSLSEILQTFTPHIQTNASEYIGGYVPVLSEYLNSNKTGENDCGPAVIANIIKIMAELKQQPIDFKIIELLNNYFVEGAEIRTVQGDLDYSINRDGTMTTSDMYSMLKIVGDDTKLWSEVEIVHGNTNFSNVEPIKIKDVKPFFENQKAVFERDGVVVLLVGINGAWYPGVSEELAKNALKFAYPHWIIVTDVNNDTFDVIDPKYGYLKSVLIASYVTPDEGNTRMGKYNHEVYSGIYF